MESLILRAVERNKVSSAPATACDARAAPRRMPGQKQASAAHNENSKPGTKVPGLESLIHRAAERNKVSPAPATACDACAAQRRLPGQKPASAAHNENSKPGTEVPGLESLIHRAAERNKVSPARAAACDARAAPRRVPGQKPASGAHNENSKPGTELPSLECLIRTAVERNKVSPAPATACDARAAPRRMLGQKQAPAAHNENSKPGTKVHNENSKPGTEVPGLESLILRAAERNKVSPARAAACDARAAQLPHARTKASSCGAQ